MRDVSSFMVEIPLLIPQDPVTRARQILRDEPFREIYVHDGQKKLLGMIDITDVLRVTQTRSNVTVDGFVRDCAEVSLHDPVESVARAIRDARSDSAVVLNDQRHIIGGVLLSDIFPVVIGRNVLSGQVQDYMTRRVVTCRPDDRVQRVHDLICESTYTAFPVVDKGDLIGIISRRDLLRKGRYRKALGGGSTMAVSGLMTTPAITVEPEVDIATAAEIMVRHNVSRLPVMDHGQMTAIIDRHDVLQGLTRTMERAR